MRSTLTVQSNASVIKKVPQFFLITTWRQHQAWFTPKLSGFERMVLVFTSDNAKIKSYSYTHTKQKLHITRAQPNPYYCDCQALHKQLILLPTNDQDTFVSKNSVNIVFNNQAPSLHRLKEKLLYGFGNLTCFAAYL